VQYKICTFVETNQDMENQLKSANILNAYKSLRKIEKVYVHFQEDNS
jgi:hypothetical protein